MVRLQLVLRSVEGVPSWPKETTMKLTTAAGVMLALAGLVVGVAAQQRGAPRTILQRADLSVPGHEVITAVAEFSPGSTTGRHTHPGEMVGYVFEGTLVIEQDGKSTTLTTGHTVIIPAGVAHNNTNNTTLPARMLATYVVEKGQAAQRTFTLTRHRSRRLLRDLTVQRCPRTDVNVTEAVVFQLEQPVAMTDGSGRPTSSMGT